MAENEGIFSSPSELVYGPEGIFDGSPEGILDIGPATEPTPPAGMEELPSTLSPPANGNGAAVPVPMAPVPLVTNGAAAPANGNGAAAGINWKHIGLAALVVGGGWYAYQRWIGPRMAARGVA